MKYYAVIDTNVLISAMLKFDSVPGNILQLTFGGVIIPVYNEEIINEYENVLSRDKFHLDESIISTVIGEIKTIGIKISAENCDIELPDPKDKVFYEIVMEERKAEDAYLVTGNIRHFPTAPFIVTPREMLDIILSEDI